MPPMIYVTKVSFFICCNLFFFFDIINYKIIIETCVISGTDWSWFCQQLRALSPFLEPDQRRWPWPSCCSGSCQQQTQRFQGTGSWCGERAARSNGRLGGRVTPRWWVTIATFSMHIGTLIYATEKAPLLGLSILSNNIETWRMLQRLVSFSSSLVCGLAWHSYKVELKRWQWNVKCWINGGNWLRQA